MNGKVNCSVNITSVMFKMHCIFFFMLLFVRMFAKYPIIVKWLIMVQSVIYQHFTLRYRIIYFSWFIFIEEVSLVLTALNKVVSKHRVDYLLIFYLKKHTHLHQAISFKKQNVYIFEICKIYLTSVQ